MSFRVVCWCVLLLFTFPLYGQVTTVTSYSELIAYSGSSDSLFVDHPEYYGTFAFKSSGCSTTDNGTHFEVSGGCWQRINSNFSPRFWPVGGLSSSNELIETQVDAINSAAYAAWSAGGDTVEIDKMYEIDEPLWLLENNTYLGTADSAGFVRATPPKTILTHPTEVGDKKIYVKSNDGFKTGHKINVANSQEYDSIAGYISYTAGVSPELGGDTTIFLSGRSMRKVMEPGDSVSLFFPMVQEMSWSDARNAKFINLVFDGNRAQYTLNYDWRLNTTFLMSGPNKGAHIDNCRFYNIPTENIFLCRVKATHNRGSFFNGSAFHFSCPLTDGYTEILYNQFDQLNEVGNDVMKHSEAGFTFSSKVRNFRIAYNKLSGLGETGVGIISNDDSSLVITDNLLESSEPIKFRFAYTQASTNTIYNNKQSDVEDAYTGNCFLATPEPMGQSPCNMGSSEQAPLKYGDLINITLDSLYLANSNFNFMKGVFPVYESEYFEYAGASMVTFGIDDHHSWNQATYNEEKGLIFDNGHEGGIYGVGNWGYEPCGSKGGCNALRLFFRVKKLPATTSAVPCPLEGVKVLYDGEMGTWNQPPVCDNSTHFFDQEKLGQPVLKGTGDCQPVASLSSVWLTKTRVKLEWVSEANNQFSMVFFRQKGEAKWRKKFIWDNDSETELHNMPIGVEFEWMVKVRCGDEWSAPSEVASFISIPPDCGSVTFERLHTGPLYTNIARLNWDNLEDFKYNVRWKKAGASNTIWSSTTISGFRYWLTGLEADTRYIWQVRTVCIESGALINSDWSEIQRFRTPPDVSSERSTFELRQALPPSELPQIGVTVFPNPARHEVGIVSVGRISKVVLADTQGKVIKELDLQNQTDTRLTLSVRDIPAGTYLLSIQLEHKVIHKKLIIE